MRVAYFPNQCAQNSVPVMQAMLNSLRRAGHIIEPNSQDADAAIIWSVLWSGRMAPNKQVYENYKAQNKPVIIVDVGALYRGETWKVALNHINQLGYYGHTENLDMDRPRKLGISLAVNLSRNPAILIAAQHKFSLQLANWKLYNIHTDTEGLIQYPESIFNPNTRAYSCVISVKRTAQYVEKRGGDLDIWAKP